MVLHNKEHLAAAWRIDWHVRNHRGAVSRIQRMEACAGAVIMDDTWRARGHLCGKLTSFDDRGVTELGEKATQ